MSCHRVLRKALLLVCILASGCGQPSDSSLEQHFLKRESDFEKLQRMISEDPQILSITRSVVMSNGRYIPIANLNPSADLKIAEDRWSSYVALIDSLDIVTVFYPMTKRPAVEFRMNGYLSDDDSDKGIAYNPVPPTPLVSSLDTYVPSKGKAEIVYKALKGNWYLFRAFSSRYRPN